MKLIIVDDEWELAEVLARFLRRSGHDCLTALDVQGAIDAITQHRPGLVLTAFRLPDGDGLQIINHVRQTLPQTPVIVMTGIMYQEWKKWRGEPELQTTCASHSLLGI